MPIDYKKYPPNWKSEIRPTILKRAENKCEFCGVENYSVVRRVYKNGFEKDVRIILTVAHLDHDETNHEVKLERLRALCQQCHLRYDAKEKYKRVMNKPWAFSASKTNKTSGS